MKQNLVLNTFEYSIVPSSVMMPDMCMNETGFMLQQLPLLSVWIDFEKGVFKVEGDWHYMVASNKHSGASWYSFRKGRVKIEASLFKSFMVNVNTEEYKNDGMVFPFKGTINDGNSPGNCSGLIVINDNNGGNCLLNNQWSILFCLYDCQFDSCEIIFKLPVYIHGMNADLN